MCCCWMSLPCLWVLRPWEVSSPSLLTGTPLFQPRRARYKPPPPYFLRDAGFCGGCDWSHFCELFLEHFFFVLQFFLTLLMYIKLLCLSHLAKSFNYRHIVEFIYFILILILILRMAFKTLLLFNNYVNIYIILKPNVQKKV